jgi:hypothetical protein
MVRPRSLITVCYPTKADRDKVIEMGMEAGIDQTFNRLEAYLAQGAQQPHSAPSTLTGR